MGQTLSSTQASALAPSAALGKSTRTDVAPDPTLHVPVVRAAQLKRGDPVYYIFSLQDAAKQGNPELKGSSPLPANILLSAPRPPEKGLHFSLDFDSFSVDVRGRHVGVFIGQCCIPCRRPTEKEECEKCFKKTRRDVIVERMNEDVMWVPADCQGDDEQYCNLEWVESQRGVKGNGRKVAVLWSTFNHFLARASRLHMPVWRLGHSQQLVDPMNSEAKIIHPDEVAARALYFLGKEEVGGSPYSLSTNNCESYATWCCTDSPESAQVQHALRQAYNGALGVLGVSLAVLAVSVLVSSARLSRATVEEPAIATRSLRRSRSRSRSRERVTAGTLLETDAASRAAAAYVNKDRDDIARSTEMERLSFLTLEKAQAYLNT